MKCRFLTLILLFGPVAAEACSCAWPDEVTETMVIDALCSADVVFIGDVDESQLVRDSTFEYRIWPKKTYKGILKGPSYALSTVGGMCGYPFKDDGRYLIFGNWHKETTYLSASICGFTSIFARDGFLHQVLEAMPSDLDTLCGEEQRKKRRLQRIREDNKSIGELEQATLEMQSIEE